MKFYNRERELSILEKHYKIASKQAILDVLIGRRRIGKTELVKQFIKDKKAFYFFVARKPILSLLREWSNILREEYPSIGEFSDLDSFLGALFELSAKEKIVVVFDEFQNFKYIYNPAFSIFQKNFDNYKKRSKIYLILIGSMVTMMEKIFSDSKEPLFGRATKRIYLEPFDIVTVTQILKDLKFKKDREMLDIFSIFNGIPKYYVLLEEENLEGESLDTVIKELIIGPEANLKKEGEDLLKEEFGKDYHRYFEILSLLSRGKTKLSEIANIMKLPTTSINVYLTNLEKKFRLIERRVPLLEKPRIKLGRYYLKDVFLLFWFRFVYRYLSWVERGAEKLLLGKIGQDFSSYQGLVFENIARDWIWNLALQDKFFFPILDLGQFWDRTSKNQIDIVALNKELRSIFLAECKLNPKQITQNLIKELIRKSNLEKFKYFKQKYLGIVSFGKIDKKQKEWLKEEGIEFFDISNIFASNNPKISFK